MLKAWPTASGCSRQASSALDHVVDVAPGADLRAVAVDDRSRPASAASMNARIAPPPIWPGPKTLNGCTGHRRQPELVVVGVRHVLAGELRDRVRPARLADRADRRDLPSLDVERVRAEHLARREVDEALERVQRRERGLERVVGADHVDAHRPHRALEHGVDAGDRGAVDDVRRAARELGRSTSASSTSAWWNAKFGCSASGVPMSASRCRLSSRDDLVVVDEPPARASCR